MTQEVKLRRVPCPYRAENARFLLECDFSKQYDQYYRKRLEATRLLLQFNCRSKWAPTIPIYSLAEVAAFSEELADECIVIGTIFKRMKLQPDVVEELSKGDFHVKCERYHGHYTSPDDTLVLEDFDEAISLIGNIDPKKFVTGIVVALLGISIDGGSQFLVRDVCFAEPNQQLLKDNTVLPETSPERPLRTNSPIYLMVVSGLGFHHDMDKTGPLTRALQNMIDFIWGGGKFENDTRSSCVARILVAGDSLLEERNIQDSVSDVDNIAVRMKQLRQVKPYSESIRAVQHMDDFFAQLSKTINVDVMPGPSDPSSHLLPQQPFHPCMFPKSCMYSTFNCTTNPFHAIYNENVEILATSGQNVDIISKFSGITDAIEIMKSHLLWGNSAPSAPDNLYSVPYEEDDPYVIDFIPEIYITGCQEAFRIDHHYYNSVEATNCSQSPTISSFKTDSNVINVTPESVRGSTTRLESSTPLAGLDHSADYNSPGALSSIAGELGNEVTDSFDLAASSQIALQKNRTLLVTVPRFSETSSSVLINLRSLECELLCFT